MSRRFQKSANRKFDNWPRGTPCGGAVAPGSVRPTIADPDLTIARYVQDGSPGQLAQHSAQVPSLWLAHSPNKGVGAIQHDLALLLRHPSIL